MRMKNPIVLLIVAAALAFLRPAPAQAQACSVTVSIATVATASGSCFIPSGDQGYIQITGTWVGTVHVQESFNNGVSWQKAEETTANTTFVLSVNRSRNRSVRVYFSARTSGTVTGTVTYNPALVTRLKYSNIPIGSVAYASLGTSVSVAASTSLMISDITVPAPFTATGVGVLIGATTGTNTVILSLYNASGGLVANTAVAGTTTGAANAFQEIAFTGSVNLSAGVHYCGLQMNGTTDKYRAVAASTFVDVLGGTVTGAAFGTMLTAITPPTTFTADKGPVCYVY